MHSILLIASGAQTGTVTEAILYRQSAVIARTTDAMEAVLLLKDEPFDAIVCAIDDLDEAAADCLKVIETVDEIPTVIVTGVADLPLRSFDINRRIVSLEEGIDTVRTAVQQQLRRIPSRDQQIRPPETEFEFSFSFTADPDRVGKARAVAGGFVQRCMAIDQAELTRVELVLEEALVNAVLHGSLEITSEFRAEQPAEYKRLLATRLKTQPFCDRQVSVQLQITKQQLAITVSDEGSGFDANATAGSTDRDAIHRSSGRGLLLMQAFADSVVFNDAGNSVTVTKQVAIPARAQMIALQST